MGGPHIAVERLGADYFQDPYSVQARLRAQRPVTPVIMPGGAAVWLITGYAEARAALADPRMSKRMPGWHPEPGSVIATMDLHMLNSDPPDHGRLRRLVNKAFTVRQVERLRPRITAITTGLLSAPPADRADFRAWSATIVADTPSPDVFQAHATAMARYFMALLAAKRRQPGDDLLSALLAARDDEDRLSEDELVSMAFLLLVAGHETTVNLIASGMLALLLNPAELARLRADPALITSAVEELLRYVNPVSNATFRCATEPVELGGVSIGRGDPVLVSLSGANRDPARFGDPDQLDLGRDSSGQLAFGHGIHYCLGAQLARLEAGIAISGLLSRFGSISLAVPAASLRWRPSTLIHGLEALPVRLAP